MSKIPYALIIRDGWGYNPDHHLNAVHQANTPCHDAYVKAYPTALIAASGENVGLPPGNQGSSEVGHLNMGAGRVVYQSLVRINRSIEQGQFFKNDVLIQAIDKARRHGTRVHAWGLVQDQGVHAHSDHLAALLKLAKDVGLDRNQFIIHIFSDGRDTPPQSAKTYVKAILSAMDEHGMGIIGSVTGRYFAMDRDNRWQRVQEAYELLTNAKAVGEFDDIYQAIDDAYQNQESDEFIKPRIIKGFHPVSDNDTVIFFNYRLDRTRELTKAFVLDDFDAFPTRTIDNLYYVCFTEYYDGVASSRRANVTIAFPPIELTNLFGDFVSRQGLRQLRIAETEKFAHVTFFFNGQSDVVFENEERILVPSPDVPTYDLQPEMSAFEVKAKALDAIASNRYDVIILNFANPDMVGHTGDFQAARQACEVVDACVGEVVDAIIKKDGVVLLTADHGNAEQMIDYVTGKPMTAHTSHLVWAHLISNRADLQRQALRLKPSGGKLADLIPTLIEVMDLEKPVDMEGQSLIERPERMS